ncbi:MAG: pyridoxamine 5'-phosphate oxidase family protein [Deltaproteobacteria bacterium]|nr:pyridoxamine 5'-phosphate oxidase family protein [Deltaproteobacteria bacterium]NND28544.1 pyridoxamine 5'-phosphate oxidase family protein [Myxococcales bacterium]MBT8464758.1 pyridoxamine 5'-phosphate oxidase family protein [Deltaproteobacteria bacterium]MBT8482652.1 pyridoxamine 5'-phosphate oxidase family protein [Deltaproteobacteria bacterium]NNK06711.1 pyridoxamine 5'-phosphate oxidase family protein [Myxococcales bacterium]
MAAPATTDLVWKEIEKRSFAVLSYVNPKGRARSSGIVYIPVDRVLYVRVATDSWKAKHIRQNPHVALNVTIAKRVPFMPWIQIPDATIAFSGTARVLSMSEVEPELLETLVGQMIEHRGATDENCIIEIRPAGHFATYGVGVSLLDMRDPEKARGRAPVH